MPFMDSASNGYWRYVQVQTTRVCWKLKNETAAATIPDTGMGLKDAVYLLENGIESNGHRPW